MNKKHQIRRYLMTAGILILLVGGYWFWAYRMNPLPRIPKPSDPRAQWGLPVIPVRSPSGEIIAAEVAWTDKQRQKGLMYRTEVPPGTGMLFVNESEGYQEMWMKNTWIPLDIVFIDASGTVTSVAVNVPASDPRKASGKPAVRWGYAKYVLEIGAGESKRLKIKKGSKLKFEWKRHR